MAFSKANIWPWKKKCTFFLGSCESRYFLEHVYKVWKKSDHGNSGNDFSKFAQKNHEKMPKSKIFEKFEKSFWSSFRALRDAIMTTPYIFCNPNNVSSRI